MANHDPNWELYRSFLAVMREGSLSGAARMLGMTQPSLGRHIRELEANLSVALFARSPQGLTPTDIAHELVPHAQSMAVASAALRRAASASHDDIRGVIRVTASEIVGAEVLPTMLTDFRRQHPGIVIELSLSNQSEDLLRRDADIAIRMVQPTQGALVARHVGKVALGLYAHQRYIKANGRPESMDELTAHSLIGFDHEAPYIRNMRPKGSPFVRENFSLRTDSDLAALASIRAGYGIGIIQTGIARRDPKLVRLMPDSVNMNLDTWVVMHEDLKRSMRNRKLFDHLAAGLGEYTQLRD